MIWSPVCVDDKAGFTREYQGRERVWISPGKTELRDVHTQRPKKIGRKVLTVRECDKHLIKRGQTWWK